MRCARARDAVSLDLDGRLPPDNVLALEQHLADCAACRRYRDDLLAGRRFIAATAPVLSDSFDWRLRLRLNRALTEAAREAAAPWPARRTDRRLWWRYFGSAAGFGLAAVLAVALFAGPLGERFPFGTGVEANDTAFRHLVPMRAQRAAGDETEIGALSLGNDRRSLTTLLRSDRESVRPVALGPTVSEATRRDQQRLQLNGWSGDATRDLETIMGLRARIERLQNRLWQRERELNMLNARLDTLQGNELDLRGAR